LNILCDCFFLFLRCFCRFLILNMSCWNCLCSYLLNELLIVCLGRGLAQHVEHDGLWPCHRASTTRKMPFVLLLGSCLGT
jgi:hypothetical protein